MREPVLASKPSPLSARERNGYFDLLRGVALLRVVTYHTLGWSWLHVIFPAIGVMFALAGSLMVGSLARRAALPVVGSRVRRLLPPVWLYGIVAIAVGWVRLGSGGHEWPRLVFWVLPLRDPQSNSIGSGFVDTLWYVRAYLWFVLLSPFLLRAFRKAPAVIVIAPLALLPVVALTPQSGWSGRGAVTDLLAYGSCWTLGFAEHEGYLLRIPFCVCGVVAATMSAVGLVLQLAFPIGDPSDVGPRVVGYALWSAAVVLLLMRWRPDTSWLQRMPWFDRTVAVVNARAVTIYIWHDSAIVVTAALVGLAGLHLAGMVQLPVVLVFTAVAMLAFGWVEDLAARRRPSLLPAGRRVGDASDLNVT